MDFSKFDKPTSQGNVGLGRAISYFTSQGVDVMLPLNDTQDYDLVVEHEGELKRVQVKTSHCQQNSESYIIDLRPSKYNRSEINKEEFNSDLYDLLFILIETGKMYLIPTDKIDNNTSITVNGGKWEEYVVTVE